MNLLGYETQLQSILIGVGIGIIIFVVLMLLARKYFVPKPEKFAGLRKELEDGREGARKALKAFDTFKELLNGVEKNL